MNDKIILAIPMAGESKRFKENGYDTHKAFLNLNKTFILDQILNRFPLEFYCPIIICTFKQFKKYKSKFDFLLKKYPSLEVKIIEPHNLGPTYSVRQIDIDNNNPIVVHYCDFLVDMDYESIHKDLKKGYILAPFFRGFHPASLGTTTFCYMKLNPNKFLITLKEKSCFTNNRIEEPCSTGIYAFPKYEIFRHLADKLLLHPESWGFTEAYTSLCLNIAIENGFKVFCREVEKFICLGTPRDYEEYIYWENIFLNFSKEKSTNYSFDYHIITAAGEGSRFTNYGYFIPKVFIEFMNKPLIKHSINSIASKKISIISLEKYKKKIEGIINKANNYETFFLSKTPNGQLRTLNAYLTSKNELKNFFVSSADYNFQFSEKVFNKKLEENNPDIVIFTTPWKEFAFEKPSNYGFVMSDSSGKIYKIIEKPKENDFSNIDLDSLLIGTFWFKSSKILKKISSTADTGKELFIAKTINSYLSELKVLKLDVKYWLSLGTPKELHLAQYWFNYFQSHLNNEN